MPELPDLQVFASNLQKQLAGKKLEKIDVIKKPNVNVSSSKLKKALTGKKVAKVFREGKELRFSFGRNAILGIHLMLRGKLYWLEEDTIAKNTLIVFYFSKNIALGVADPQSKARITLNPESPDAPDVLSPKANLAFWKNKLQSKAGIKNVLLDQHIARGIGNAYADEILWAARISPFSIAASIPAAAVNKLVKAIKTVLTSAQKKIRQADVDIIGGEIRDFMLIHNSKKKKSPLGAPILRNEAGARKTYYTKEQKLYK
jgi:formamidopyrimidine-DNA glycosylase